MINPENTSISNIIQTEQLMFRDINASTCTNEMHVTAINEKSP